jgi:error-prone DNA polymerase
LEELATSDLYWERIVSIEPAGVRETFDLQVEEDHNFLAGDLVVHNSHAASFALIAYATAYLRRHHIEAFVAALLNAQPMGFYSVATIVEDAKRHGVEMRAVCVVESGWDCALEEREGAGWAIRMGLRYVKGLGEAAGRALVAERGRRPFAGLEDLVRRTRLGSRALEALAEAGALGALGVSRRSALWEVRRLIRAREVTLPLAVGEGERTPAFPPLDAFEVVAWDHGAAQHSVRGHPLAPLRGRLRAMRLPTACEVNAMADGSRVRYAGLVICRQRPGTAGGVVFLSMEDETGFVNVVLWDKVFEGFPVLARTAVFLGVSGRLESREGVAHVIARRLWAPQLGRRPASGRSRDFR